MGLKRALLIVDLQNDFCPGGALAVPAGDKIVPTINKYIKVFSRSKLPIFASRDWHPKKSAHFKKFGGIWPRHCLKGSRGARFHPKLKLPPGTILLYKGMDPQKESYSVFQAKDRQGRSFLNLLKLFGVEELYICGLATDYCVKFSTLDALKKGFKVKLLVDAIKGVNLKPQVAKAALKKMLAQGAKAITLRALRKKLNFT